MANSLGIDYGSVLRTGESIKTSRMNRELRQEQRAGQAKVAGLQGRVAGGDTSALRPLIGEDPKVARETMDAISQMDEKAAEAARANAERVGKMAAYVLGAPASQREAAYQKVLSILTPEQIKDLPADYDENSLKLILANAKDLEDQLSRLHAKGGASGIKSADTNAIYKQAAAYFGGVFAPDGSGGYTISGLDKDQASKLTKLSADASRLFMQGGISHSEAVKQASVALGFDASAIGQPTSGGGTGGGSDPLGLR